MGMILKCALVTNDEHVTSLQAFLISELIKQLIINNIMQGNPDILVHLRVLVYISETNNGIGRLREFCYNSLLCQIYI